MKRQKEKFLSLIFTVILFCPVAASTGTLFEKNTIQTPEGRTRYFHYYLPSHLKTKPPLVILLHGGTQDYSQILKEKSAQSEWLRLSEENGFLLIVPNGVEAGTGNANGRNQHWNDCRADAPDVETAADDVGLINQLIDWAASKYAIDASRVYASGASNGGMMSYRLAAELSHRIAAIAAFIANLPANSECPEPKHPIPVFICNGTDDLLMPWYGGKVAKGGTVISSRATRDFWIRHNSASKTPSQTRNYRDVDPRDSSHVRSELYDRGSAGTEVMFYTIKGGGHTIPSIDHQISNLFEWIVGSQNHDIEGARHAWNFLRRHSLSVK